MKKIKSKRVFFAVLILLVASFSFIYCRQSLSRYRTFGFGKFDLGNMSQVVFNTSRGNFMEVTGYFGANFSRWAMSHVDPILVFFAPVYWFLPDAGVLLVSKIIILLLGAVPVALLAKRLSNSIVAALFWGFAYLTYPSVGFISVGSSFHGSTLAVTFFLFLFYFVYLYLEKKDLQLKKKYFYFSLVFALLSLFCKENVSLLILVLGLWLILFKGEKKLGTIFAVSGVLWLIFTFFVLIPSYSPLRKQAVLSFAKDLKLSSPQSVVEEYSFKENYFLYRYAHLGGSYWEIVRNVFLKPRPFVRSIWNPTKRYVLEQLLKPLGFFSFLSPSLLLLLLPPFLINFLSSEFSANFIELHRVALFVPGLFLSALFGLSFLVTKFRFVLSVFKIKVSSKMVWIGGSVLVLLGSLYAANIYKSPLFYPDYVDSTKKGALQVKVGEDRNKRAALPFVSSKDLVSTLFMERMIPARFSVSLPNFMGGRNCARHVCAIFPAKFDSVDFAIADLKEDKVLKRLNLPLEQNRRAVSRLLQSREYCYRFSSGTLFAFERCNETQPINLSVEELESYQGDTPSKKLTSTLSLIDVKIENDNLLKIDYYYQVQNSSPKNDFLVTSLVDEHGAVIYQVVNLPSSAVRPLSEWKPGRIYRESFGLPQLEFLPKGKYHLYLGQGSMGGEEILSVWVGELDL